MFDCKSIYALNKKDSEAIVCPDVTGKPHRLTRTDFDSEEDFLFWKNWSDKEYQLEDNGDNTESRYTVSLSVLSESAAAAVDPEELMIAKEIHAETDCENKALVSQIHALLTERQFRRLWLFHGKRLNQAQIADLESTSQQNISASIVAAKKKIKNILRFAPKVFVKRWFF